MDLADIVQSGVLLIAICALGYSFYRNGRSTSRNAREAVTELQGNIEHVNETLKDPHSGLGAIKESVDAQKNHCANLSGRFDERLLNLEKERDKK